MACFDPNLFTTDGNGNYTINWVDSLPVCDTATLTAACQSEQSVHIDPASGKLWGDPTPCRQFIRQIVDPNLLWQSGNPALMDTTGIGLQQYGTPVNMAVTNPSDCLPAWVQINWQAPCIVSRFVHDDSGPHSTFIFQYRLTTNGIVVKDDCLHWNQYNASSAGGGFQAVGSPALSLVHNIRLAPGGSTNITLDKSYRLEDQFDNADPGDPLPSRVNIGQDRLQVEIVPIKDC